MQARFDGVIDATTGRDRVIDALLAVAFALAGVIEGLFGPPGSRPMHVVAGVAAASTLAWRRSHPAASAVAASAVVSVGSLVAAGVDNMFTVLVPLMICMFSVGLREPHLVFRRAVVVVATAITGAVLLRGKGPDDVVYACLLLSLAVVPARLLRGRLFEVAELAQRVVRAELEARDRAEVARLEERNRLACELHDIIGHSVSLMVVHAAAAEAHLSEELIVRRSLGAVQDVGRQAVADLARSLGLLRGDAAEMGLAPPSGMGDLDRLAIEARRCGEDITLRLTGEIERVPAALGLTVYRIVQEGLTNARRHAPGTHVDVTVGIGTRTVLVIVTNGRTSSEPMARAVQANGSGHGLAGLRERAAIFGGTLDAGQCADGGYELRASIPFEHSAQ